MQHAGVDEVVIRERLDQGIARALPFRFVTAASYAPNLEDALERTMLKGESEFVRLIGVSVKTLQNWEQDRRRPTGPAASLIAMAELMRPGSVASRSRRS